jgi:hypothetical protein
MKIFQTIFALTLLLTAPQLATAQSVSEMEAMCESECGPPAWQIAIPNGAVETSRDGENLVIAVLVPPADAGHYNKWTATIPAAPEGSNPDTAWLHLQPELVVLEWTVASTPLMYTPASGGAVTYLDEGPRASRTARPGTPASIDCNCEVYHAGLREDPSSITDSEWSFSETNDLSRLWLVEDQCSETMRSDRWVRDHRFSIGWIKLSDSGEWTAWSHQLRHDVLYGELRGEWLVRTKSCPPPEVRSPAAEDPGAEGSGE